MVFFHRKEQLLIHKHQPLCIEIGSINNGNDNLSLPMHDRPYQTINKNDIVVNNNF